MIISNQILHSYYFWSNYDFLGEYFFLEEVDFFGDIDPLSFYGEDSLYFTGVNFLTEDYFLS